MHGGGLPWPASGARISGSLSHTCAAPNLGATEPRALLYCALGRRIRTDKSRLPRSPDLTRKQLASIVITVLVASVVSAMLAYRHGLRRGKLAPSSPAVTVVPKDAPCVEIDEAAPLVGQPGCVTGRILRVYTSRNGNTFLDFCADYKTCPFTSVVFSQDRAKFGNLGALKGRKVELRGLVTEYQGRAEIIIRDQDQIRMAP